MKHLLSGVAIAAAFAIAAPVWAQTTTPPATGPAAPPAAAPAAPAPSAPPPPAVAAPKPTSAVPPTHHVVHHVVHHYVVHHVVHHVVVHRHYVRRPPRANIAAGNRVTQELNREELARIARGNPTPIPATPSRVK